MIIESKILTNGQQFKTVFNARFPYKNKTVFWDDAKRAKWMARQIQIEAEAYHIMEVVADLYQAVKAEQTIITKPATERIKNLLSEWQQWHGTHLNCVARVEEEIAVYFSLINTEKAMPIVLHLQEVMQYETSKNQAA